MEKSAGPIFTHRVPLFENLLQLGKVTMMDNKLTFRVMHNSVLELNHLHNEDCFTRQCP